MLKKEFPQIHYYDQDFVDIYDRTWAWVSECWHKPEPSIGIKNPYLPTLMQRKSICWKVVLPLLCWFISIKTIRLI